MTSLEILDHLIRYVRLREDLHIVLALERRDAGTPGVGNVGPLKIQGLKVTCSARDRPRAVCCVAEGLRNRPDFCSWQALFGSATCGERGPPFGSKADSGKPPQGVFMSSRPSATRSDRRIADRASAKCARNMLRPASCGRSGHGRARRQWLAAPSAPMPVCERTYCASKRSCSVLAATLWSNSDTSQHAAKASAIENSAGAS